MTALALPALDGRTPLGFLAALGLLRLVDRNTGHHPRLAWSTSDAVAVLHDAHPDIDTLVADLVAVVAGIPDGAVLPGLPDDFPPLSGTAARMRFTRPALRTFIENAVGAGGPEAEQWLAALVTDLTVDAGGNGAITLFAAPSGRQSMRSMLFYPLKFVRDRPEVLREALTAWRRYPGVSGEYLDHRVLFDVVDTADGTSAERGVPGATWLALMAYPLLRTTGTGGRSPGDGGQVTSTGWQDLGSGADRRRLVYPLWSEPLDIHAVKALLSHEILDRAAPGTPPPGADLLSIFRICHAHRRKIPGRTFAGVLTPTEAPPARTRRAPRGARR
jgi:hypothetical protein